MKNVLIMLMLMFSCLVSLGQTRDTCIIYNQRQVSDTCIVSNIQFEVNSVDPIRNGDYELFIKEHLPYLNENKNNLIGIYISSAASPEGPLELNRKLANGRSESIRSLIDVPEQFIHTRVTNEDWDGLYKLISESDHPQKEKILKILNTSENPKRSLIKPGLWNELIKNYFSQLRNTKVEMYFSYILPQRDTIERVDTLYLKDTLYLHDTLYLEPIANVYPILSLKTNLITDLVAAPNIQAELYTYVWGLSLEFEYTFPWWSSDDIHMYYQLLNGTAGLRKYKDNNYKGWYVGVYGQKGYYDIMPNKVKGWQGEHWGTGLSCGYVWRKGWWRFEPYIRVGYLNSRYDTYRTGEPFEGKYYYNWNQKNEDFIPRRFNLNYIGPTMIGFNISYDIIRVKRYEGFK